MGSVGCLLGKEVVAFSAVHCQFVTKHFMVWLGLGSVSSRGHFFCKTLAAPCAWGRCCCEFCSGGAYDTQLRLGQHRAALCLWLVFWSDSLFVGIRYSAADCQGAFLVLISVSELPIGHDMLGWLDKVPYSKKQVWCYDFIYRGESIKGLLPKFGLHAGMWLTTAAG